jgi:hypothetical protein
MCGISAFLCHPGKASSNEQANAQTRHVVDELEHSYSTHFEIEMKGFGKQSSLKVTWPLYHTGKFHLRIISAFLCHPGKASSNEQANAQTRHVVDELEHSLDHMPGLGIGLLI